MTEALEQFFANNFSDTIWLAILLFSMLPITEARLAIPFGLSVALWGGNVANPWIIFVCAYIGSTLPTIFIIPLLKPIFAFFDHLSRIIAANGTKRIIYSIIQTICIGIFIVVLYCIAPRHLSAYAIVQIIRERAHIGTRFYTIGVGIGGIVVGVYFIGVDEFGARESKEAIFHADIFLQTLMKIQMIARDIA